MFWNIFLVSAAIIVVILVVGTLIANALDNKQDNEE